MWSFAYGEVFFKGRHGNPSLKEAEVYKIVNYRSVPKRHPHARVKISWIDAESAPDWHCGQATMPKLVLRLPGREAIGFHL